MTVRRASPSSLSWLRGPVPACVGRARTVRILGTSAQVLRAVVIGVLGGANRFRSQGPDRVMPAVALAGF